MKGCSSHTKKIFYFIEESRRKEKELSEEIDVIKKELESYKESAAKEFKALKKYGFQIRNLWISYKDLK